MQNDFEDYTGTRWFDNPSADAFPLMCPDTGRNCHSLCICYRDDREGEVRRKSELHYRGDGYTHGECVKYRIRIDSDRD